MKTPNSYNYYYENRFNSIQNGGTECQYIWSNLPLGMYYKLKL